MSELTITEMIAVLKEDARRARAGTIAPQDAIDSLLTVGKLLAELDLNGFPVGTEAGSDDRTEMVTLNVGGIDVSVRGRTDDVYVNVEDLRDDDERRKHPLVVALDDSVITGG